MINRRSLKEEPNSDEQLTSYLLGELDEEEQQRIEAQYIGNHEFYERLLVAEDELIDAYVRGELSETKRQRFESHFLRSPERRERVGFANTLMAFVANQPQPKWAGQVAAKSSQRTLFNFMSWPALFRFAAAAIVIVAFAWLAVQLLRSSKQPEQPASERASVENRQQEAERAGQQRQNNLPPAQLGRNEPAPDTTDQNSQGQTASTVASFTLAAGLVRGAGEANKLTIARDVQQVNLIVSFRQGDYASYRAVIQTVAGRNVVSRSGLKAQARGASRIVLVTLPANALANDDYILTLSGTTADGTTEPINEYPFRVVKK